MNIAESTSRFSDADKRNFFVISRGSLIECIAILDLLKVDSEKREQSLSTPSHSNPALTLYCAPGAGIPACLTPIRQGTRTIAMITVPIAIGYKYSATLQNATKRNIWEQKIALIAHHN